MKNKRILTCAITGSIHIPTMSKYLPITPEQISQHALDAADAGAASVHIHARDPKTGQPSADLNLYKEIVDLIRAKNKELIICLTTGGGHGMSIDQRIAVVPYLKPDLASCNLGTINYALFSIAEKYKEFTHQWEKDFCDATWDITFRNTFGDLRKMVPTMYENGTKPELEVYDVGHLYNCQFLMRQGIIKPPLLLQFVTGLSGGIASTPYDLMNLHNTAERLFGKGNYQWGAIGAGLKQFSINAQSLFLGGHVRVGMEDNLMLRAGVPAKSNAELVEKMVRIMREFDYEPASPAEARDILSMKL
jgi:uncharacterized protein (DUF849 family)